MRPGRLPARVLPEPGKISSLLRRNPNRMQHLAQPEVSGNSLQTVTK